MSDLSAARRKLHDWPAVDRADAKESAFGVRKPSSIGRNRCGRIPISHRPVLMRSRDPCQVGRLRVGRGIPSKHNDGGRYCQDKKENRGTDAEARHPQILTASPDLPVIKPRGHETIGLHSV